MTPRTPSLVSLLLPLLVVIGVAVFIAGAAQWINARSFESQALTANAIVVEKWIGGLPEPESEPDGSAHILRFTFRAEDGVRSVPHEVTRAYYRTTSHGAAVEVLYLPDDPAVIRTPGTPESNAPLLMGIGVALAVVAGAAFVLLRRFNRVAVGQ